MFDLMKVGLGMGFGLALGVALGERAGEAICNFIEKKIATKSASVDL